MTNKKKSVASVDGRGAMIVGISDVIRYDDVMTVNGYDLKLSKVVQLGKKHGIEIAALLEHDLKSKTGLLITFPVLMLMDKLQRRPEIGTGEKLLALVKP